MDVKEFKAWFEGFCDSIGEVPTAEQFAKIKAKVQGIKTAPEVAYREPSHRWPLGLPNDEPRIRFAAVLKDQADEPVQPAGQD